VIAKKIALRYKDSMKHYLMIILCAVLMAGCGFTPVYHQKKGYVDALASIRIDTPKGREHQQIRVALEDRLAPMGMNPKVRYILEPNVSTLLQPISIESDGTTSRYRMIARSTLRLYDASDRKLLMSDRVERFSSYTIARADFSTYTSNKDATRQLMDELAEELRARLIRYFAQQEHASSQE
jgi:hypothetical protein